MSLPDARSILKTAKSAGIDTLDTAMGYGASERILGEIGVENMRIITKLPAVPDGCSDIQGWIKTSVLQSLDRLRITRIEGLLLHRPLQLKEPIGDEIYSALLHIKQEGLIEKTGFSIYSPDELDLLWENYKTDMIQAPLNILDHRLARSGWLDRLWKEGVSIHVRSIFLQGLLLMEERSLPPGFRRWARVWRNWGDWLKEKHMSPLEACVGFALSWKEIERVLVGVDSEQHLRQIIKSMEADPCPLPDWLESTDRDLIEPTRWKQ